MSIEAGHCRRCQSLLISVMVSSFPKTWLGVTHVVLCCELMVNCDMTMRSVDAVPQRVCFRRIGRTPWRIPMKRNIRDRKRLYPSKVVGNLKGAGLGEAGQRISRGRRGGHTRSAPYGNREAQYTDVCEGKHDQCYRRIVSSVRRIRTRGVIRGVIRRGDELVPSEHGVVECVEERSRNVAETCISNTHDGQRCAGCTRQVLTKQRAVKVHDDASRWLA